MMRQQLDAHIAALRDTLARHEAFADELTAILARCVRGGGKVVLFGNGGSAADAQHMAGELVNRFARDRPPIAAVALTTDTSVLTCVANDSSYDEVFARQVEALARPGDAIVAISTSGGSRNVLRGIAAARARGCVIVGLTGQRGVDAMPPACDLCLVARSLDTARVQEVHEFVLHVVCGMLERALFDEPPP